MRFTCNLVVGSIRYLSRRAVRLIRYGLATAGHAGTLILRVSWLRRGAILTGIPEVMTLASQQRIWGSDLRGSQP